MSQEFKIVQIALELMEIEYTNWNTCAEHCPVIRGDRHGLNYYIKKVKEGLKQAKVEDETDNKN